MRPYTFTLIIVDRKVEQKLDILVGSCSVGVGAAGVSMQSAVDDLTRSISGNRLRACPWNRTQRTPNVRPSTKRVRGIEHSLHH